MVSEALRESSSVWFWRYYIRSCVNTMRPAYGRTARACVGAGGRRGGVSPGAPLSTPTTELSRKQGALILLIFRKQKIHLGFEIEDFLHFFSSVHVNAIKKVWGYSPWELPKKGYMPPAI